MSSLEEVISIKKPKKIRVRYFDGKLVVKIRKNTVLEKETTLNYAKKLVERIVLNGYEIVDEIETNTLFDSTSPDLITQKDDSIYMVDLMRV
jgi:hypothetical protein